VRLHIEPQPCFKKPIDQVTRADIKSCLRNLFSRRAARTVEAVHAVLSLIFNEAINPELKTFTVFQSFKRRTFKKPKGGKTRVVDMPDLPPRFFKVKFLDSDRVAFIV
jgi:hypothetical protein